MTTPEHTPTAPNAGDEGEQKDPKWYRDELKKRDDQLAEQQKTINRQGVRLMEKAFSDAGLDPTKGLGKAIAQNYDGDPDAEAIKTFAQEEYDWEPPEQTPAQVVNEAQGRVAEATAGTESIPQDALDLDIAKAEEEGDFARSIMLKVQQHRQKIGM